MQDIENPYDRGPQRPLKRGLVPAVGPRLRRLLFVVLGLFALLAINSAYLVSITATEALTGRTYQDYFYQWMFLVHLALGLLIIVPVVAFGIAHMRNTLHRPNRAAVRAGIGLFSTALVLLFSGVLLTRFGFLEVNDPIIREIGYWVHVLTPLLVIWLFVLHRLAGAPIHWSVGLRWAGVAAAFALAMVYIQGQDPRQWDTAGAERSEELFFPSLARTSTGNHIPARSLMMTDYCQECHQETAQGWRHSMHHLSSFNNPAYRFAVEETRKVALERDGTLDASRFCAGCHDPAPFFSGAFDKADFGKELDPMAKAGITCTACHAITHLNSPRGNADYTLEEPIQYPFAYSDKRVLQWINRQLVKAKPEFHKKTFLKPLHKTSEFCGTCHKVHLPEAVNHYKWLRGQDHYDSYLLSGVSGHGVTSFYYPPKAVPKCAQCHMPLIAAENDFGAKRFEGSEGITVHNHMFAAANTAVPHMVGMPKEVEEAHRDFLAGSLRVDLFGLREGGTIGGRLTAPLRPEVPRLRPGYDYLLETVIRTLKPGHWFTQGTADSNEVWLDVVVRDGERIIGRSGAQNEQGEVDPWSHFVNAYVLDRDGNRIDRRNGQDIFVPLYNHQIPPGAADVIHYRLQLPAELSGPVTVEVSLKYRKFDTTFLRYIEGDAFDGNDLPVVTIASDRLTFPVLGSDSEVGAQTTTIPPWQRWNDYGIGLLRKGSKGSTKGELRQAEQAFSQVETLGRADGALNLARVYLKEGRLDEAVTALSRAAEAGAPPWSVAWFSGLVNKQNGYLDQAIEDFEALADTRFNEARERGFDFSKDYRLLNELGQTLFERAKRERGEARQERRRALLQEAQGWFLKTLEIDPENAAAHYNLALVYAQLGEQSLAARHRELHMRYKPDDNARARAVAIHRRSHPAANHAAEAVVIYDLQRPGTYGLNAAAARIASRSED